MHKPIWQPGRERIANARISHFRAHVNTAHALQLRDYAALHAWSVQSPEQFWADVWDFCGVIATTRGDVVLERADRMPGASWFPSARLNFAENLLRRRDHGTAILFRGEDRVRRRLSFHELYDQVSRVAQELRASGVCAGDRVAGFLPNLPEAVIAMLAAASIGAIWSSCSPDFGVQGVVDRFGQIEPKILFAADGYFYNGKRYDSLASLAQVSARVPSIERIVVAPYVGAEPDLATIPRAQTFAGFMAPHTAADIEFTPLPFQHPLYILYSSGTTGAPKCIVHGAGGTLLQHLKEHQLHTDIQPGDTVFYFTTCGWMMWNWMVSALASEATLALYDGCAFYPNADALFDYIDEEQINLFGTSAKFIDTIRKHDLAPAHSHRLDSLKTILSTGSPLVAESFDYVYERINADLLLASISGGTDIISCFALGNPTLPVWRGELQCCGLGMDVQVFDDNGNSIRGAKGELVCTRPFPSMPLEFWNDDNGKRYQSAYFARFPGVWCHGDYVALTEHGGMVVYGRSDAILNPGGVRIGSAEIYRQVEQIPEVLESVVIGQTWQDDVRVVLFVHLREGVELDHALIKRIRDQVRLNTSPRHVPARIVQVSDIPRTRNGKLVELAVRAIVHGQTIKNLDALANPEALDYFRDRPELQH